MGVEIVTGRSSELVIENANHLLLVIENANHLLNSVPVDTGYLRGGGDVEPGDGVESFEVGEHPPPPLVGPAEHAVAADEKRVLRVVKLVPPFVSADNLHATREPGTVGAHGRSVEAGSGARPGPSRSLSELRVGQLVPPFESADKLRPPFVSADNLRSVEAGPGARPGTSRSLRGRERRRIRCALARPGSSGNLRHLEIPWDGGRRGVRRDMITALAQQLPHVFEPLRVGLLWIRSA